MLRLTHRATKRVTDDGIVEIVMEVATVWIIDALRRTSCKARTTPLVGSVKFLRFIQTHVGRLADEMTAVGRGGWLKGVQLNLHTIPALPPISIAIVGGNPYPIAPSAVAIFSHICPDSSGEQANIRSVWRWRDTEQ